MGAGGGENIIGAEFWRSEARTNRTMAAAAKQGREAFLVACWRQAVRPDTGSEGESRHHDVSQAGGRVMALSIVLMMIIRPRRQTGHCVKECPVSSSQRQR